MDIYVLRTNRDVLLGLFSSKAKAQIAAEEYCKKFFGAYDIDDDGDEVIYSAGSQSLTIDTWELDLALMNGRWTIL
jgi:hypothetical protein